MIFTSQFKTARTLIPWGWEGEYNLSGAVSGENLTAFTRLLVQKMVPLEILAGQQVIDLKGRDPNLLLVDTIPVEWKPRGYELIYIRGHLSPEDQDAIEFCLTVESEFAEFVGNHHIKHSCKETRYGDLPPDFKLYTFSSYPDLSVDLLRLGFEFFKSNIFTSMLGFAPEVTERLLIDAKPGELRLRIVQERMKLRNERPLLKDQFLEKLADTLECSLAFNLLRDLSVKT